MLVNSMVGRAITEFYQTEKHESGESLLEARTVCVPDDISFTLKRGETRGFPESLARAERKLSR
jgi:ABC-type sugar transport system, ATPase component